MPLTEMLEGLHSSPPPLPGSSHPDPISYNSHQGFPGCSAVKSLPANARDIGDSDLIPRSGRSPGGEHGYPLQSACLENLRTDESVRRQSIGPHRVGYD